MRGEGIELVTVLDENYPGRLRNIPDAPYGLFFRGRLPSETSLAVAVIGARECSGYGRCVAAQLGETLARHGVTVVSGMARGIDGISQEAALEAGGYSVGVLGSGVDVCYPAQNRALYDRLMQTGAVLSSFPMGTPARPHNFPPRNRIVSGLADAVVVIEARVKSGTLITVDMALEQGREVYVVPGRVTDRLSDGCNRLVKQGAGVFLSPESFLEEIRQLRETKGECVPESGNGGKRTSPKVRGGRRETAEKDIAFETVLERLPGELAELCRALDFSPKSPEEIRQGLPEDYEEKQIITGLMRLCLENLAIQVSPGHFCRKGN